MNNPQENIHNRNIGRLTNSWNGVNIIMVLNLSTYESDRKPPRREDALVAPMKLVIMVEESATFVFIFFRR